MEMRGAALSKDQLDPKQVSVPCQDCEMCCIDIDALGVLRVGAAAGLDTHRAGIFFLYTATEVFEWR